MTSLTQTAAAPRPNSRMPTTLILAAKEIREGLRNRWVLATTLLLAALALTLALLGSAPTGTVGASRLDVVTVSLASLTIFLVPLIALLISHDAIAGEAERGTLLLLLAYPIRRSSVILGKFLGQLAILAFATTLGYGVAALAVGWNLGPAAWARIRHHDRRLDPACGGFPLSRPAREHARAPALHRRRHRHRPLAVLRDPLRHGVSRPARGLRRPQPAAARSSTRCSRSTLRTSTVC